MTENEIKDIVAKVLGQMKNLSSSEKNWDSTQYGGRKFIGIFDDMNAAIEAANKGYKAVRAMSVEEREKIITEIRKLTREEAAIMAELGVAETKMGKVEHKRLKHILVADKTPGTEDITASAKTGDYGLTLIEPAPFGVVGAITPSTNPSETVICNSIGMIAAGNGVVFNPHPGAIATSNYA
ncbi:MAG: aldehyde dehydrogenase family protein, partial [Clostridia bacterium]|nr:aldehyde dehydrogenase family protein [Clostridia bacterium]